MSIQLSILIPAVFERDSAVLTKKLLGQIGSLPIELLVLTDNRKRPLGCIRQTLLDMAQGKFLTWIDDDDDVSDDYIQELNAAITGPASSSDVIVFNQQAQIDDGNCFLVIPGLEYENEKCEEGTDGVWRDVHRKPWHWCVWNSELAKSAKFPAGNVNDDDWCWIQQLLPPARFQYRIDRVMHYYHYSSQKSLAGKFE